MRTTVMLTVTLLLLTVGVTLAAERSTNPVRTRFAPARSEHLPPAPKAKKPSPRLSRKAIAAAQPGCDRFVAAVKPHLYGAGVDDLRDQIHAFRSARGHLSRDLRAAITRPRDRRKARPLIVSLSHNRLLARALGQLNSDRVEAAFATLSRWDEQTVREERIARRLGLGRCMDATRQS